MRLRERWRAWRAGRATDLWPSAAKAGRAASTSWALALFVLGVTLDDLHAFRLPMIYVGAAAAIAAYAFAPPWLAGRLLARLDDAPAPERPARLEASLLRRRATLAVTVAGFLVWLVLFASSRTPRW